MFLYDRNSLPPKGGEAELCSARSEETELKTVSERKHPREEFLACFFMTEILSPLKGVKPSYARLEVKRRNSKQSRNESTPGRKY